MTSFGVQGLGCLRDAPLDFQGVGRKFSEEKKITFYAGPKKSPLMSKKKKTTQTHPTQYNGIHYKKIAAFGGAKKINHPLLGPKKKKITPDPNFLPPPENLMVRPLQTYVLGIIISTNNRVVSIFLNLAILV